jgi:hypothetical protein
MKSRHKTKMVVVASLFLLSMTVTVNAQTRFGLKAGANFSKFSGEDSHRTKGKVGFYGGFLANIPILPSLSVQPELLYNNLGATQKEGDNKATHNLNYMAVPVMLQYNHSSGFYAETGPEFSVLLSAKLKYDIDGEKETVEVSDQLKSFNAAWGIGVGYELESGIGVGMRYNLGLTSIDGEGAGIIVRNNAFSIGVHYKLGGRK